MIPFRLERPGARFLIAFAMSLRSCALPIFLVLRPLACGAGPRAIASSRSTESRPFRLRYNEDCLRGGTKTAAAGWRFVTGVVRRECNGQDCFGHVGRSCRRDRNLCETFHQDSWWYGSGVAMGWGATGSLVRNMGLPLRVFSPP